MGTNLLKMGASLCCCITRNIHFGWWASGCLRKCRFGEFCGGAGAFGHLLVIQCWRIHFYFWGLLVFVRPSLQLESGASALGLATGHTLGPLWAQDLRLAAPGPSGRPGSRSGWLGSRLADLLAGSLDSPGQFGFWEPLFVFSGVTLILREYRSKWDLERLL